MALNFEFRNKLKTLPVALSQFQTYQLKSKHTPVHLKIVYNVIQESSFIEATFSNDIPQTEITNDLTSSINYIFSELISTYLMSYKKVFLSRIIIESDVDMLGVVFDSIKVTCKFKGNVEKYSISTQKLLKLIFSQTVDAERNEILERPATGLNIFLLRHKLRSIQLTFDYSLPEEETAYGKDFSSDFELALYGLIHTYENPNSSHEASSHLSFDLKTRDFLNFISGSLFSTQILDFNSEKSDHFKNNQIEHILGQIDPILEAVDNAQITQLILNMTHDHKYRCQFELRRSKNKPQNFIDLTKVESVKAWQKIFSQIVDVYSISTISSIWLQTICVNLKPIPENWLVSYHSYCLTYNSKDLLTSKEVADMVNKINDTVSERAKVDQFVLETENSKIKMIQLHLQPIEKTCASSELAMKLSNTSIEGRITRYFNLSDKGYFLEKEKYKDLVK